MNHLKVHQESIVFDAHVDTLLRVLDRHIDLGPRNNTIYLDIPRLREGGVKVQVFAIWVNPEKFPKDFGIKRAFDLMNALHQQVAKYPLDLGFASEPWQVKDIIKEGKIACLFGLEGGHTINNNLNTLRMFHEAGIKYLTLTWMNSIDWADSSTDKPKVNGLSEFGVQVIQEMNKLGMLIDLSHTSDQTTNQVFEITTQPVIMSHSCCRALSDDPRNVSDDLLRKLQKNNGVMGINFYSKYLALEGQKVTVDTVLNHIEHVVEIAGINHVGLGSDFDGANDYPVGLEDCSKYPAITDGLFKRGYKELDIKKILGENFLRVFNVPLK